MVEDVAAPSGGIEAASFTAALLLALRRAGLSLSPDRAARLAEALALVPPRSRAPLYWACRIVLVSSVAQLPVFDRVFAAIFDGMLDPAEGRGERNAPPPVGSEERSRAAAPDRRRTDLPHDEPSPAAPIPSPAGSDDAESAAREREAVLAIASPEERLHEMSFADLTAEEVARVRELVRQIALTTPRRLSRRTARSPRSGAPLDLRRTVRGAQRTAGDPLRLIHARRRLQPRRLVMLCDVSGSMEPFTRIFLTLLQGAAAGSRAEAFVFSTRLTRLTRQLAQRDPDRALRAAAASACDWAGGTRLAASIRRFVDDYGRRSMARGAVVVILSDGWAHDDPAEVAAQMARLKRLAYRIIWVNPRKAAVGYLPLVGGMAAALPYCDAFVSGHSYQALLELADVIKRPCPTAAQV